MLLKYHAKKHISPLLTGSSRFTLTLRSSSAKPKTLNTTLRQMLDEPPDVTGAIILRSAFADQRVLSGIMDKAVDVDTPISISLEPMEIIVMEGTPADK